jgi:hypothetical protein
MPHRRGKGKQIDMKVIPLGEDGNKKYLYRYVDGWHNAAILYKYEITKETLRGYWIKDAWLNNDNLKFVYKEGKNNFAKSTKEAALENYYHRKARHVAILKGRLRDVESRLDWAKKETDRTETEQCNMHDTLSW